MITPSDERQNGQLQEVLGILIFLFIMFTYCGGSRPGQSIPQPQPKAAPAPPQIDIEAAEQGWWKK